LHNGLIYELIPYSLIYTAIPVKSVKIGKFLFYSEVKMNRLILVCLVAVFLFAACQKKEEPKVQTPFPAGTMAMQNKILQLQESVRQNPKNLNAWIELGNSFMDGSRFPEAVDAYQKALEMDPKNTDVRVDMGTCYRSAGQPDKAAEEYRKAIAVNPGHPNAHRNLGIVLAFDLKNKQEAIKEFEEYLRVAPTAPDAQRISQLIRDLKK
jgi:cytochrome c-type biogenesis protein CcmH/NrfG